MEIIVSNSRSVCVKKNKKFIKFSSSGYVKDEVFVLRTIKNKFPKKLQKLLPYSLSSIKYVVPYKILCDVYATKIDAKYGKGKLKTKVIKKVMEKEMSISKKNIKKWGNNYSDIETYFKSTFSKKEQQKIQKKTSIKNNLILETPFVKMTTVHDLDFDEEKYKKFKIFLINLYDFLVLLQNFGFHMVDPHGYNIAYIEKKKKFVIFDFDCIVFSDVPNFIEHFTISLPTIQDGHFNYIPAIKLGKHLSIIDKHKYIESINGCGIAGFIVKKITIKKCKTNEEALKLCVLFSIANLLLYPTKSDEIEKYDPKLPKFVDEFIKFIEGRKRNFPDVFKLIYE